MIDMGKKRRGQKYYTNKAKKFNRRLNKMQKHLTKNTPKSELWFYKLYEPFRDKNDLFNQTLHRYIPDVQNTEHKYVIEIDGSIHDTPARARKDHIRDMKLHRFGYVTIRIKAYDIDSFIKGIVKLSRIKGRQIDLSLLEPLRIINK